MPGSSPLVIRLITTPSMPWSRIARLNLLGDVVRAADEMAFGGLGDHVFRRRGDVEATLREKRSLMGASLVAVLVDHHEREEAGLEGCGIATGLRRSVPQVLPSCASSSDGSQMMLR